MRHVGFCRETDQTRMEMLLEDKNAVVYGAGAR